MWKHLKSAILLTLLSSQAVLATEVSYEQFADALFKGLTGKERSLYLDLDLNVVDKVDVSAFMDSKQKDAFSVAAQNLQLDEEKLKSILLDEARRVSALEILESKMPDVLTGLTASIIKDVCDVRGVNKYALELRLLDDVKKLLNGFMSPGKESNPFAGLSSTTSELNPLNGFVMVTDEHFRIFEGFCERARKEKGFKVCTESDPSSEDFINGLVTKNLEFEPDDSIKLEMALNNIRARQEVVSSLWSIYVSKLKERPTSSMLANIIVTADEVGKLRLVRMAQWNLLEGTMKMVGQRLQAMQEAIKRPKFSETRHAL